MGERMQPVKAAEKRQKMRMEETVGNGEMVVARPRFQLKGKELVEWRQQYVALGMLAHRSVREIHAELVALEKQGKGVACSTATVGRDMQAVRATWAKARKAAVDELIGEQLARLVELEKRWWPVATGEGVEPEEAAAASERVLAIMRQRAALLGLGGAGRQAVKVTAGAMAAAGPMKDEG